MIKGEFNLKFRYEIDGIGEVPISQNEKYGAQTQRAISLYSTSDNITMGRYKNFVCSILQIKEASAAVNRKIGAIELNVAINIENVCRDLTVNYKDEMYPIHPFHSGGGITANMIINETVANIVNYQFYEKKLGTYSPCHPNDHINLNHSTSDCLLSASHMAVEKELNILVDALSATKEQFLCLSIQHGDEKKISRTCLQDAVPIAFSEFYFGYIGTIDKYINRFVFLIKELKKLNLGGNIIGRKGDCAAEYTENIYIELSQITGVTYQKHDNFFQCSQSHDTLQATGSELELLAHGLVKIGKDLRLMSSGPYTGLSEIFLPAVQAGSSAMPGKVNPTIPEFLVQTSMQAIGHCASVRLGHVHGELDYNPWIMIVVTNLIDAIHQLSSGLNVTWMHCLYGIEPNTERNNKNITSLIPIIIELKAKVGYSKASEIAKKCEFDVDKIKQVIAKIL